MKLAALISGGKDSCYALYEALTAGHEVTHLVAIKPQNPDSYMYHSINIDIVRLISQACGIPLILKESHGRKEEELDDLSDVLCSLDIDGVIVGAIESVYQESRVRKVCETLGIAMYAPLWHRNADELLREMAARMDIRIVQVAAGGMGEEWLGVRIDEGVIRDLQELHRRYRIHLCGEGGEYETLVLDAPYFKERIELVETERAWYGDRGVLKVLDARVVGK